MKDGPERTQRLGLRSGFGPAVEQRDMAADEPLMVGET
jgi:hypothetical protein